MNAWKLKEKTGLFGLWTTNTSFMSQGYLSNGTRALKRHANRKAPGLCSDNRHQNKGFRGVESSRLGYTYIQDQWDSTPQRYTKYSRFIGDWWMNTKYLNLPEAHLNSGGRRIGLAVC
jgi:hypothetical protein